MPLKIDPNRRRSRADKYLVRNRSLMEICAFIKTDYATNNLCDPGCDTLENGLLFDIYLNYGFFRFLFQPSIH